MGTISDHVGIKEVGVLFSTPMVQSNRRGEKGQTRRLMNPQPPGWIDRFGYDAFTPEGSISGRGAFENEGPAEKFFRLPFGVPGDRIYVKEATWIWCKQEPDGLTRTGRPKFKYVPVGRHVRYCADHPQKPGDRIDASPEHAWKYKGARFMPKWAARDRFEILGTGVERLCAICDADAINEGIERAADGRFRIYGTDNFSLSAVESYRSLWEQIHGADSWTLNSWVWVVKYRPLTLS